MLLFSKRVGFVRTSVSFVSQALFAKRVCLYWEGGFVFPRKLVGVSIDNAWFCVERLASFVASVV